MKNFLLPLVLFIAVSLQSNLIKAQSTYAQVYQLIQTHCAGSSCHDGTTPTLNINVSADSFYHEILNATPVNPAAAAKFDKLLSPGNVQGSFFLRKISNGISDGIAITHQEGAYMPSGLPSLAKNEIELVRQWILFGAPETGNVVDTAMINTYYRNGGIDDTYSPHLAPAPGTGFQLYFGRFFLNAGTRDTEVFYKVDPHITQNIESNKLTFMMPASDHHFDVYLFQTGGDLNFPWGIRPVTSSSMEFAQYAVPGFAGLTNFDLPNNTAFFFPRGSMFDLNLHIQNPSADSIFSCDLYVNVYTEPANTTTHYMKVNGSINESISIAQDGQPHSFPVLAQDSGQTNYWNIWKLASHTHKYGTAFNMWLLNPDGSQGPEIYDGNYSYEEGFNTGYYRWGLHSTIRTWPADSLFVVNPLSGISGMATWVNTAGPDPVLWGFSTAAEMQAIYFFYIDGEPLQPNAINTPANNSISARVFPNPATDEFVLKYNLTEPAAVQINLLDLLGNKVTNLITEQSQNSGQHTHSFSASDYKLQAGIYLVSFNIGGKTETQKLIVTD